MVYGFQQADRAGAWHERRQSQNDAFSIAKGSEKLSDGERIQHMKALALREAIGLIADDLIAEAAVENAVCGKRKRIIGVISGWAACLALCIIYFSLSQNQYRAEDLYWHLNHVEVHSLEQAEQLYGYDLLLRQFVVPGLQAKRTDYSLELEERGCVSDKETWIHLNTCVAYEDGLSGLDIFFDRNDSRIAEREKIYLKQKILQRIKP